MMLHLMYKALIEMSPTREAFLSRLFSRPIAGADWPTDDSPNALLTAFAGAGAGSASRSSATAPRSTPGCSGTTASRCRRADLGGIDYVYRAFYSAGPDLRYSFGRGAGLAAVPDLPRPDGGRRRAGRAAGLPGERGAVSDAARHAGAQPDRAAGGRFRRPEGAALGGALPRGAPRDGERVLHVERRAVSLPSRADAWQRFYDNVGALPITARQHVHPRVLQQPGTHHAHPGSRRRRRMPARPALADAAQSDLRACSAAYAEGHISNYYDVIELSR